MIRRYHAALHGAFLTSASLALAALAAAPGAAQSPDPLAVLEEASERYTAARALCATFRQTLVNPLLDQRRESEGVLCQRQPDLFSMRFTDPDGDLVVADGTHLWVYYPSMDPDQVIRMTPRSAGAGVDFHREFLENPRQKYDATYRGRETVEGRPAHRVTVVPKQRATYRGADLWIDVDGHLVRRIEIREESGSVRTVALSDIHLDPDLSDSTFRFTPPAGARVITR